MGVEVVGGGGWGGGREGVGGEWWWGLWGGVGVVVGGEGVGGPGEFRASLLTLLLKASVRDRLERVVGGLKTAVEERAAEINRENTAA